MSKIAVILLAVAVLSSCDGRRQTKEISETRTVDAAPVHETPHQHVCPMDDMDGMDGMDGMIGAQMPAGHPPISPFAWELPDHWVETRPTPMRMGNFSVEDRPGVECYLTVLTGMAGGIQANVNRWRQQMGLAGLDQDAVDALPKIEMLGQPAFFLDIEGDFTGMSGHHEPGYRMLAVLCSLADETIFVKMTGPAAAVEAEREHFLAFCASLKEGGAPVHAPAEKDE